MKELVALLEGLGAREVKTYHRSGNTVFRHRATHAGRLAGKIEHWRTQWGERESEECGAVSWAPWFQARFPSPVGAGSLSVVQAVVANGIDDHAGRTQGAVQT